MAPTLVVPIVVVPMVVAPMGGLAVRNARGVWERTMGIGGGAGAVLTGAGGVVFFVVLGFFDGVAQDIGPGFGERALVWRLVRVSVMIWRSRAGVVERKVLGVFGVVVAGQQPQGQQAQFVGVGVDGGQFFARRCVPSRCFHLG